MNTAFDPADLWEAVQGFVRVGVERLGEDRAEQLNGDRASLAVIYRQDDGSMTMVFYGPEGGEGPVEMNQGGRDTLAAAVGEQFDRFLEAGMERLDESVRQQTLDQLDEGAQLMAILDFTAGKLRGVIVAEGAAEEKVVEMFSLALE